MKWPHVTVPTVPAVFTALMAVIVFWVAYKTVPAPPPAPPRAPKLELVPVDTQAVMPSWLAPSTQRLYVPVPLVAGQPAGCQNPAIAAGWSTDPAAFQLEEVHAVDRETLLCVWSTPAHFVP